MIENWGIIFQPVGTIAGVIALGILVHLFIMKTLKRISRHARIPWLDSILRHCTSPTRVIFPVFLVHIFLPLLKVSSGIRLFLKDTLGLLLIFSVAWLVVKFIFVLEDVILSQYKVDVKDNLEARRIHTQIQILKKVAIVVIGVITIAMALMTFDKVRQLGTTILTSAGIVGIIIGIAAQKSIAALLAGIQLAITQPIRIDDVVIVEGEWGRIEEITLTYVVVRIWDLRRLIVPMTYFLEKSFQNWTRVSAELLGSVFLYVDYTVPVDTVREELNRLVKDSQLWDNKVCVLQVTNSTEHCMELRALMSASDSSSAWSLRCHVREKLIEFIQKNYPSSLPKVRADIAGFDNVRPSLPNG